MLVTKLLNARGAASAGMKVLLVGLVEAKSKLAVAFSYEDQPTHQTSCK